MIRIVFHVSFSGHVPKDEKARSRAAGREGQYILTAKEGQHCRQRNWRNEGEPDGIQDGKPRGILILIPRVVWNYWSVRKGEIEFSVRNILFHFSSCFCPSLLIYEKRTHTIPFYKLILLAVWLCLCCFNTFRNNKFFVLGFLSFLQAFPIYRFYEGCAI